MWTALPDRLSDEPSGKDRESHVSTCPSCAAFVAAQREALAALAPLAAARKAALPPEGLSDRIVARIQREAVEANAASALRPVPFLLRTSTRRYAPIAAGLAIFLAVGLSSGLLAGGGFFAPLSPAATPTFTDKGATTDANEPPSGGQTIGPEADVTNAESLVGHYPILLPTDGKRCFVADAKAGADVPSAAYDAAVATGAFDGAYAFRCYLNADGSLTVLALLPSAGIQDLADRVSAALAPCASPFRIAIIDAKDIGSAFAAIGIQDADAFLSSADGAAARLLRVDLGR